MRTEDRGLVAGKSVLVEPRRCVWSQVFIETLLERADRAERRLLLLSSHTPRNVDQRRPVRGQGGRSADDITDKMQGTAGNRVRNRNVFIERRLPSFLLFCQLFVLRHPPEELQRFRLLQTGRSPQVPECITVVHLNLEERAGPRLTERFSNWFVSLFVCVQWADWPHADLVFGFRGVGQRRRPPPPSPLRSILDSTRERARRRQEGRRTVVRDGTRGGRCPPKRFAFRLKKQMTFPSDVLLIS